MIHLGKDFKMLEQSYAALSHPQAASNYAGFFLMTPQGLNKAACNPECPRQAGPPGLAWRVCLVYLVCSCDFTR